MSPQETVQKLQELGDRLHTMSLDEVADYLGFEGHERLNFKQSAVAAKTAWKEADAGIDCDCTGMAEWQGMKKTCTEGGLGYDVFLFKCTKCNKLIERKWRAPSLDGLKVEAYITRYERPRKPGQVV